MEKSLHWTESAKIRSLRALESNVRHALRTLMPQVSSTSLTLVPYFSRVLHVLVRHVRCALSTLVPHMLCASLASCPMFSRVLRALLLTCSRASLSWYPRCSRAPCGSHTSGVSCPTLFHLSHLTQFLCLTHLIFLML